MVETDFVSCGNRILLFDIFFFKWKPLLKILPIFVGKTLFPLVERDFLFSGKCLLLFRATFLQVETISETS